MKVGNPAVKSRLQKIRNNPIRAANRANVRFKRAQDRRLEYIEERGPNWFGKLILWLCGRRK